MPKSIIKRAVTWEYLLSLFHQECRALLTPRGAGFYQDRLNQFIKWLALGDLQPSTFTGHDLTRYLEVRRKTVSTATLAHDAKAVRKLFEFGHRNGFTANPLRDYKIRGPKRPHTIMPSGPQLDALLRAVDECWTVATCPQIKYKSQAERTFYLRSHQAIIAGLIATSCRISEMLNLKLADYDAAQMRIAVVKGKGEVSRYVYFSASWKRYVDSWLRVRPRFVGDEGFMFVNQFGGRLDYSRFRRSYDRYRKRAGIETIKLHGIRHSSITTLAQTDPIMAQQQAGHKSLSSTLIYLHVNQEHNREKYRQADPLGRVLVNVRSERAKRKRVL